MFLRLQFAVINMAHVMWMEEVGEKLVVLHFANGSLFPITDDEAKNAMRVIRDLKPNSQVFDVREHNSQQARKDSHVVLPVE